MVVARARRTIEERDLIAPGMRVLVACSGGPDSAALLLCLAQLAPELKFQLEAASVDHGLRADATLDVEIARRQAQALAIPFHALSVRVAPGSSLQSQARTARYQALSQLALRLGAQRIAVGHTRQDQAETVVLRLLRGAGLRGLSGIQPLRADGVIRPLLDCDRADVHRFAEGHFVEIARDSSNDQERFLRVRVRNELLPALLSCDPGIVAHLADLADDARNHMQWLEEQAQALLADALVDPETLRIPVLQAAPQALRCEALRQWLVQASLEAPGRAQLRQLDETISHGRGEVWLSDGRCVRAQEAIAHIERR